MRKIGLRSLGIKTVLIVLFLVCVTVENTFAWGWAVRDVSRQSSENPTYYLGDQVTLYWYVNSAGWSAIYKKAGIGTTNSSAGMNWQNIVWDNEAGDGSGNNEGIRTYTFTVNSISSWYYSLWIGFNNTYVGDNGHWYNGGSNWGEGSGTFISSSFTVSALENPNSQTATSASSSSISLSWSKWSSKNVMIVRKKSGDSWTEPTQGTAYTVGNSIGAGTVVYNGSEISFSSIGLEPATGYDYKFYSENYSYYSAGATASATTATTTATDYFRSKATGNWSVAETWESSPNNINWVTAASVPGVTASSTTILNGHTITLNQNTSLSSLTINSGATFNASDGTAKTLTIAKSTSGSSTTLSNSGTWAYGSGGSTVVFTGAPGSGDAVHAISGTIAFQNIAVNKTGGSSNVGVSFGANSSVSGTIEIGSGGFVSTAPPASFYGSNAILKFNQGSGATYNVGSSDNSWSTTVIPNYITITSGTVNLNANRTASGNLLIDGGTLVLNSNTPNLTIQGNWTRTSGAFTSGTGTVTLSGTTNTIINTVSDATLYDLVVSKTGGAYVSLSSNLTVGHNMTISSGAVFKVESGKSLTVSGTLTNSAGNGGMVIEDGASLITLGTVSGGATVKRNITNDMVYHFVSSPVSGQAFKNGFVPASVNTTFEFYYFDEGVTDGKPWINSRIAGNAGLDPWTNGTFEAGRGYLCAYNSSWGTEHTFAGTLFSGTYSPTVSNTSTGGNGWNLLGNPFPSAIDWSQVSKPESVNAFYYLYDATASGPQGNYRYHNGTTGSSGASKYIAPEQAFMVFTSGASSLNLTNSCRAHGSQSFVKSTNDGDISEFALELKYGNWTDEAKVGLFPESLEEQDNYDAYKLYSFTAGLPYLYTLTSDGTKVAYNSIPEITSTDIRLGVVIPQAGQYTINLSAYQGYFEYVTLVLQDLLTGTTQDLKQNPGYTFTGDPNGDANRFMIKFANVGIENPLTDDASIYTYGNKLNVQNPGQATLEVYNMAGQRVLVEQINSSGLYQTTLNNRTGYYIVRLTNATDVKVSKVFIK